MKYKFNEEQQAKIKAARKANKNKHIDKRLEVLELRCKGISQKEISEKTGYHRSYVCNLINEVFATLENVVNRLCDTICTLAPQTIRSITRRAWILSCFN